MTQDWQIRLDKYERWATYVMLTWLYESAISGIIILGLNRCNNYQKNQFDKLKNVFKVCKFVLVQATQSNVLPLNGWPHKKAHFCTQPGMHSCLSPASLLLRSKSKIYDSTSFLCIYKLSIAKIIFKPFNNQLKYLLLVKCT